MEKETVFVAGSTGAIGSVLCRILISNGYTVFGMTRNISKINYLESIGVSPVICDVYDQNQLSKKIREFNPSIILHQLTDLPLGLPEEKMEQARINNTKIRDIGTRNLIIAASETSARRFIAQSICFMYLPGEFPLSESQGLASESLDKFEKQVLGFPGDGIVLRYGKIYGPGTGFETIASNCKLHVDAAAHGAYLAIKSGSRGIYNFAEDDGEVSSEKSKRELNWNSNFRFT